MQRALVCLTGRVPPHSHLSQCSVPAVHHLLSLRTALHPHDQASIQGRWALDRPRHEVAAAVRIDFVALAQVCSRTRNASSLRCSDSVRYDVVRVGMRGGGTGAQDPDLPHQRWP